MLKILEYLPTIHKGDELYTFNLINDLDQNVTAYWIDENSQKKKYFTAKPNKKVKQTTYKGHRWVLTDENEDDIYLFEAGEGKFTKTRVTYKITSLLEDGSEVDDLPNFLNKGIYSSYMSRPIFDQITLKR